MVYFFHNHNNNKRPKLLVSKLLVPHAHPASTRTVNIRLGKKGRQRPLHPKRTRGRPGCLLTGCVALPGPPHSHEKDTPQLWSPVPSPGRAARSQMAHGFRQSVAAHKASGPWPLQNPLKNPGSSRERTAVNLFCVCLLNLNSKQVLIWIFPLNRIFCKGGQGKKKTVAYSLKMYKLINHTVS